jgi:hypothetical protein
MNFFTNWGGDFTQSLLGVWYGVVEFLPRFLGVLALFIAGWILATLVEKLIEGLFKTFKIDGLLKSAGLDELVERSGHKLNSGRFLGSLVKWFVIVIFLVASFDTLGLTQVSSYLSNVVLSYIPNVIMAVLVLMVSVVIADAVQKVVTASARAAHVKSSALLGAIAKWAIWIFAILVALNHLQIAPSIVNTVFTGVIAAATLAGGLAFGLGGKDVAGKMLEKLVHTVSDKE